MDDWKKPPESINCRGDDHIFIWSAPWTHTGKPPYLMSCLCGEKWMDKDGKIFSTKKDFTER